MEAQNLFPNSRVIITAEGKTHLRAVIGSIEYPNEYVKHLAKGWDNQFTILSTIAAYLAFASGLKSKLNYFPRTIRNITFATYCYL